MEASQEEYVSKSIVKDYVGAALCAGQVWITDLLNQLRSNKHHTSRSFSRHTESVKQDHAEQWEGWDGENGKFVWVRQAFGSVWITN